jgi:putative exosortase-associated protein (TIGR04073 family)
MRRTALLLGFGLVAGLFIGCAGPEDKLGRGIRNSTEFLRGGQIRRSMEQTALWEGPDAAYTTGFIRGFNRSVARTAIGLYEVITFPAPPYRPLLTAPYDLYPDESVRTKTYPYGGLVLEPDPPYPANYYPKLLSDSIFDTDTALGFGSGDVFPKVPGSRFRIFD